MKKLCFILIILFAFSAFAQVRNEDNPLKGEWNFNPEKVWEIDRADEEPFAMPAELRVSRDGTIVFRDFMKNISHIFDQNGKYVSSFAREGTKTDEVSRYLNCFLADDKIVIGSPDKLIFFTREGKFLKFLSNNLYECFPLYFINENEFLYASGDLSGNPEGKVTITGKNLINKKETALDDFNVKKGSTNRGLLFLILGVTPQIRMDMNPATGHFYYGRNDNYEIRVANLEGKRIHSFGLKREKKNFPDKVKKKNFDNPRMPEDQKKALLASLPDELAHYFKISVNKGLVYVFAVNEFNRRQNKQQIDIFSPDGTYLYCGYINFDDDVFFRSPENMVILDEYLYVILYGDNGKKGSVAKYKISLPPVVPK